MFSFTRPLSRLLTGAIVGVGLLATATAHAQLFNKATIMSGLRNPRGLAVGADGALYVAEAGLGGSGAGLPGPTGGTVSYGATGAISHYLGGVQTRIVDSLPSLADQTIGGAEATGLHHIAFRNGNLYGTIGLGAAPDDRTTLGAPGADFGQLVKFDLGSGTFTSVADISAVENTNPNGDSIDSNPYGLLATNDGFYITDAGGNSLIKAVDNGGDSYSLSVEATFAAKPKPAGLPGPPFYQAVPTSVTMDTGGTLYVGQLSGFPFPVGGAEIYKVTPGSGISGGLTGFTGIVDITYSNGTLYVLQYASGPFLSGPGELWAVNPNSGDRTLLANGFSNPGGVVVAGNGRIYVSDFGTSPGTGTVVLLVAAPEPGSASLLLPLAFLAMPLLRRKR